jgi:hypothetical protein
MVAYNFNPRFAPLIESGKKLQTIRDKGKKRHAQAGERLQLYTGMRTRNCRKLLQPLCLEVLPISIRLSGVSVNGKDLDQAQTNELALADGFENFDEFIAFFSARLPLDGLLIKWSPDKIP